MKIKRTLNTIYASLLFTMAYAHTAFAEIKKPNWVEEIDKDKVSEAGEEINLWIFVFMAVIIALFSIKPGYFFIVGKTEEAIDSSKNILIGAVVSVVLGGVIFSVLSYLS